MSFAKKLARKQSRKANKGTARGEREARRIKQQVKETYVNQRKRELLIRRRTLRNLSACFLLATNERYGYGRDKLLRLRDKMQSEFDSLMSKTVTIEEIVDFLATEMEMKIEIYNDPHADTQQKIEVQAVKEMSCAYLMALLDEFGFKKKRLNDAYTHACGLSDRQGRGEITYKEIREKVEKIFARGKKKTDLSDRIEGWRISRNQ